MDRKKISLVIASVLCIASLPTSAALNIYSNSVEQAEDAKNVGNYEFSQSGLSSEEAATVPGFGKEMPLGLSLQIIVPNDWKVNLNEAAVKSPVDWVGKNTWPYVLEELAKDNNLQVAIDWNTRVVNVFSKDAEEKLIAMKQKEIMISEAKKKELEKEAKEIDKKAEEVNKQVAEEKKKLVEKRKYASLEQKVLKEHKMENPGSRDTIRDLFNDSNVLPLDKTIKSFVDMRANKTLKEFNEAYYILKEERMLSDNLSDWAVANDWELVWEADSDFRITREVEIKETMLNAIDKVVGLYKKSKKPLMVKFYVDNRVVKVEDFNYEK